ncbi:hypothetical protein KHA96_14775 [Bacillus sp. FJAT-49711]|uniref:hypothetical protein n=1 Tax=Bacillus sp. FJAT-49711 TaxID=2833585 RepID=UPI001BC9190B|nr:hypothetical protein [Bacillus sp. FJAT-49711]MBS4219579.1 hypothetical protein [Bacillus sp. FJAT-49711]
MKNWKWNIPWISKSIDRYKIKNTWDMLFKKSILYRIFKEKCKWISFQEKDDVAFLCQYHLFLMFIISYLWYTSLNLMITEDMAVILMKSLCNMTRGYAMEAYANIHRIKSFVMISKSPYH